MKLKYNGQYFVFLCTFHEKDVPKSNGFRWNPQKREWWTNDEQKALKLIQYADEETKQAFEEIKNKKQRAIEQSKELDANINIPGPEGVDYMPFQKAGIKYCATKRNALIADEMGLGKTIQAIGLMNLHQSKKVLIISPASVKYNWENEINKWLSYDASIQVLEGKSTFENKNITIINYDILKNFHAIFCDMEWDMLIVDEAHMIKNHKAQRSRFILGDYDKHEKQWHVKPIQAFKKYFLTGTPIVNKPVELYPIISALGFKIKFWDYAHRYCNAQKNRYGWDLSGASNLNELQENLRSQIMVRRLKKDVLMELPEKIRQAIVINPENKIIEQEKKHFEKIRLNEMSWSETIGEISKLRHKTALKKVPYIIEHIKQSLENVNKIVVFAHHKDVIQKISEAFAPHQCLTITGDTAQEDRPNIVEKFQNDDNVRIIIGNIQAAGTGITLTAANTVIFAELDWVPGNMTQAEDRCHRIGQKDSVLVQHIIFKNSIDAKLSEILKHKQKIIEKALDEKVEAKNILKELFNVSR